MCVPEALGGGGLGHLAYYVAWQALFHHCGPQNWLMLYALAHWAFGPSRLLEQTTERARAEIMPGLMDGTRSMCFGLSEPNAGSDASMITTKAIKDGDGLADFRPQNLDQQRAGRRLLRGVCRDRCGTGGGQTGRHQRLHRAHECARVSPCSASFDCSDTSAGTRAELAIEDLYVEPWQILGELGKGFAAALYGVSLGRIYNSARAVGYGRWAVEQALDYAKTRQAFGNAIADYQGCEFSARRIGNRVACRASDGSECRPAAGCRPARGQGAEHDQGVLGAGRATARSTGPSKPTERWD